jgi:hypothetical protein
LQCNLKASPSPEDPAAMQSKTPSANPLLVAVDLIAFVALAAAIAMAAAIVLITMVLLLAGRAEAAPANDEKQETVLLQTLA